MAGPIRISILADGKKAKQEAADTGKSLKSSLGSALEGVKGLPALAAGTAVGGLLIKGFTDALDFQAAQGKLAAQLGFGDADSKKAGKISGDLYKQAYGDSMEDLNESLKAVFQTGLASITDQESKIQDITKAVETYSDVSGEEALPATRAVSQMLKTGLAPNAQHAFDLLTRGQQLGINQNEDLLDTFGEYSTQFRKLGLSADDALGLMNQMLQGGARDADIAADAIKEFSIRAIDGSDSTKQGFKDIGLNADDMAKKIAAGGPTAKTAFGQVLTAINSISDPVKRNAAGVALFGTQWEDLGGAISKADLATAAKSLGSVEGATARASDSMTTTQTKLTSLGRTIQVSIVDAIGKYALPTLDDFVTWFQGPGKLAIAAWAVGAAQAIIDFADKGLGALQEMLPAMGKFGKLALIAAAGAVAAFNPGLAVDMLKQADSIGEWSDKAAKGIGDARTSLKGWSDALGKAKTRVEFEADIADLEQKIGKAEQELRDPKLTATKKAKLTADIAELNRRKADALYALGDKKLIATKTAKLTADKKSLDDQIRNAKNALASKDLTKERKAKLNADISELIRKRNSAQTELNALHGVTVPVTISVTAKVNAASIRNKVADQLARYGLEPRAAGGPVLKGRTYLVGENGPELVTMGASGFVTPTNRLDDAALALGSGAGGGGGQIVIQVYALTAGPEVGRATVDAIKAYEAFNGTGWRN